MPLVATRGAASVQGFGEFAQSAVATYIEDVFSTYLYTGTGANQTFNNGVDLSTKGGMVWIKQRSSPVEDWRCVDSARGINYGLQQNLNNAQQDWTGLGYVTSFNTNGFSIGTNVSINTSAYTYASWTFRKQPKFFDVVTYTGNGTFSRNISHSLASVPGAIIIKKTSAATDWVALCKNGTNYQKLNLNLAAASSGAFAITLGATSTTVDVGYLNAQVGDTNTNGATYVMYLFAHNAGGFGLTGTDNVISCGSLTSASGGSATLTLNYEPQWILFKRTDAVGDWFMFDNMRGMLAPSSLGNSLYSNTSGAEVSAATRAPYVTSTSLTWDGVTNTLDSSGTYIYIAIRRGPMKTPTSGTSIYGTQLQVNTPTYSFPPDLIWATNRTGNATYSNWFVDRLRGSGRVIRSYSTNAETAESYSTFSPDGANNSWGPGWTGGADYEVSGFRRAPGFFDVVCYTGTGSATTQSHNLGVVPEWIITKSRSQAGEQWWVYSSTVGIGKYILLSSNGASASDTRYINATPTATTYAINSGDFAVNASSVTYVAYLFATVAGVSKVGSYSGTGALQTINCGFTSGARFVLIKRTDSTGDWYVYDSARGITSGNDPYLFLNSTAAEVTGTNYVDTDTTGFKVTAAAPAGLNASGGTYIFLAIA